MKLQRTTWILLIIAVLFGGIVYFYETQGRPQREKIEAQQNKIFSFTAEEVKELVIKKQSETLIFEQTEDKAKPWRMKQPEETIANDAVVSFLVNLLVDAQSDRQFDIPAGQRKDYGLERPSATITIQLKEGKTHQVILGNSDFKEEFIYAQIDPPSQPEGDLKISLVSQNFRFALDRELKEWKQPEEIQEESELETKSEPETESDNNKQ